MPSNQPQRGPPTTSENGTADSAMAMARARVARGVHWLMYQVMPGANPASAAPSTKLATTKSPGSSIRDIISPAMPHIVIDSSSQARMPSRRNSSACGYWNSR